jgi:L-threonylcarbamoyladenylate synthase
MLPVLKPTADNLDRAAAALAEGRLVAFPTETVYGLGARALDPQALARVFAAKGRPLFDPLIIHLADPAWLSRLCTRVDARAGSLAAIFWPGPLTLVLPKTPLVPELATAGLPTVAVRMPAHPVALDLIRRAGFPLAAPSANPFGRLSPTTAAHVAENFSAGIDFVLDGGACTVGVESTILSLEEGAVILRAGGISREQIEAVIGPVALAAPDHGRPEAPGRLPSHYAPRTPLRLLPGPARPEDAAPDRGLLAFRAAPARGTFAAVEILSPTGDMIEAAARLFACLHRLDARGLELILAEPLAETGLGLAVMDRLRKAGGPRSGTAET